MSLVDNGSVRTGRLIPFIIITLGSDRTSFVIRLGDLARLVEEFVSDCSLKLYSILPC